MRSMCIQMNISALRALKPTPFPDQALYIEHVCKKRGIEFLDLDNGYGTVLLLRWKEQTLPIAMGKACVYPINSAPAMAISLDKGFTNTYLSYFAIPNLGGKFYFLNEHYKRLRRPGTELSDAHELLKQMNYRAFGARPAQALVVF